LNTNVYEKDGIKYHALQKNIPRDGKDMNFNVGKYGNLRCYENSVWRDCSKKEIGVLSKDIAERRKESRGAVVKGAEIFGLLVNGVFKIYDIENGEHKDGRGVPTGRKCEAGWNVSKLARVLLRLGASPAKLPEISEEMVLKKLKKSKFLETYPEYKDDWESLRKAAVWVNRGKTTMCAEIQAYFEEHGPPLVVE